MNVPLNMVLIEPFQRLGTYIVLEGIAGAGKSMLLQRLVVDLGVCFPHKKVLTTFEPGGNMLEIRDVVQGKMHHPSTLPEVSMLLYMADRTQTLIETVVSNLVQGHIVIVDRSFLSSVAIQGYAQSLGFALVWDFNWLVVQNVLPDLVLYVDIPAEIGIQRLIASDPNRGKDDIWEAKSVGFWSKVREGYLLVGQRPELAGIWHMLDGTAPPDMVVADAFTKIINKFGTRWAATKF